MTSDLQTAQDAAKLLGISVPTIYEWLGKSDTGTLIIRGQNVTIDYLQGGPQGQGRIRIPREEVERLLKMMRVLPLPVRPPRKPLKRQLFPGIHVELGHPGT